jgi:hypothetical protein
MFNTGVQSYINFLETEIRKLRKELKKLKEEK